MKPMIKYRGGKSKEDHNHQNVKRVKPYVGALTSAL